MDLGKQLEMEKVTLMSEFKLDARLKKDCYILDDSDDCYLLLMNNRLVPWFILVPKTDKTELYELDMISQTRMISLINRVSEFLKHEFAVDKINVAAIGNVVEQMHIHVVGRFKTDTYWPGVVWGHDEKEAYDEKKVIDVKLKLNSILEL